MKDKYIVRSLISLTDKQKDSMDLLARNICRHRRFDHSNEKISTSTIIRCLIDVFLSKWKDFDPEEIYTEEQLLEILKELFR